MGKKFKLSDMISNAWFYKLKYMNKPSRNSQPINSSMLAKQHFSPPPPPPPPPPEPECGSRKSYHITRELSIDHLVKSPPSRKSKSRRSTRRSSSISSFSCQSSSTSLSFGSKSRSPPSPPPQQKADVADNNSNVDFLVQDGQQTILDSNAGNALAGNNKSEHFDSIVKTTHFQLSPIITKKITKEEKQKPQNSPPSRRKVRIKINSPRFLAKKQGQNGHNKNVARKSTSSRNRRSISESFAIVKSSFDPQKDFEESMVEMIVQNNLTATKDLEDLLACYLSLNSDEYHDIIIKVFKQIWFDFRHR